jgi:SNF2 family DNA or RNA helicase
MTDPPPNFNSPKLSAHVTLQIGSCGVGVTVHVNREPHALGWDLLTIAPAEEAPADTEAESSTRLAKALEWIIDVDVAAAEALTHGRSVVKKVPQQPRHANLYQPDSLPPSGVLVWPLLHDEPELPLLPYQITGVDFLLSHEKAVLADDMGLGKTLQSIAAATHLIYTGAIRQALVICPRNLLHNWIAELSHWTPALAIIELKTRPSDRLSSWRNSIQRSHILLIHYEELRSIPTEILDHIFDLIIADEAHRLRNVEASITQSARSLRAARLWALSGTPVERSAEDIVALMALLEPKRFSASDAQLTLAQLRNRVRPYLLRRLKLDVLSQLPAVEEHNEMLTMTPEQSRDYGRVIAGEALHSTTADDFLKIFGILRSICDVSLDGQHSAKVNRIVELASSICFDGEKVVCFSYLLEPLRLLERRLREAGVPCGLLTGEMDVKERQQRLETFRKRAGTYILLASSRVAGEGLTLTEANHVVFVNEWWNPSANAQARDRVVRLGQRRLVHVYKFRMAGTVEVILDSIHHRKSVAAKTLLDPRKLLADPEMRAELLTLSDLETTKGER